MGGAGKGLGSPHQTHEEAGILTPGDGKAVGQSHGLGASTVSGGFIIHLHKTYRGSFLLQVSIKKDLLCSASESVAQFNWTRCMPSDVSLFALTDRKLRGAFRP